MNTDSAHALRLSLKQSQMQSAQDHLFERFGQRLFAYGWSAEILQWLLDEVGLLTGAADGLIAQQHAGALKILAKRGNTYPVGARIPMLGALAQWLKEPVEFQIHTNPMANLWTLSPAVASHEVDRWYYHLPIACGRQAAGLFAIVTSNPLSQDVINTLHSLCGILGFALNKQPANMPQKLEDNSLQLLTPREREVFALLPSGASNAVLAERLGISPGTIKIHVERILHKLAVKDRTQAAVKAVEAGFSSEGL